MEDDSTVYDVKLVKDILGDRDPDTLPELQEDSDDLTVEDLDIFGEADPLEDLEI